MIQYREILRLHDQQVSQRGIAASCGHSRQIVKDVIERADKKGILLPLAEDTTDAWLQEVLYPEKNPEKSGRRMPDFERVHRELAKSGVTLSLLWDEYCWQCKAENLIPYSYRQYCRSYREFALKSKATLRIKRKPGEILEVDWAGQTAAIVDHLTGELIPAYIFVATLPCSQYSYVEAFLSMDTPSWIYAHIHALEFFGGVPRLIVPDNLRTGVDRSSRYTPSINRTYQELAEHYETAIVPARVRTPKDKASVEGTVGTISTWIIASLRHQKFFSITDLNSAIRVKLNEFNEKPFQKKQGSRLSAFEDEEKFSLLTLPPKSYELSSWKQATVHYNYHVEVDQMFYSVPYEYIKHRVDIRLTKDIVEIFFNNFRIASHKRLYGTSGQTHTITEHMPDNHQKYVQHTPDASIQWAKEVGPNTERVVNRIFETYRVEQQALKVCLGFMKLADKHSVSRLESACEKALCYTDNPSLKSVQTILTTGQDKPVKEANNTIRKSESVSKGTTNYGFTRGANYYGGKRS